jgi:hypothetical protein
MIQELYLKRAVKIRKEYLKIVNDINRYDKVAKDLAASLTGRTSELEDLLKKLNENKISNPEAAKQELHNILMQTEDDMNKVDLSISALNKEIENLQKDELSLYREIRQTYFNLTDEEIRNQVQDYLKKLNL